MDERTKALKLLVSLGAPLEEIWQRLSAFEWDADRDLVLFTAEHAASVLARFLDGSLSAGDVEAWANALEGREDVGFHSESGALLRELVFELANPLLTRPLTREGAVAWMRRLRPPREA